jgi:lauroyl/myristoyl acyltransferase
VRLLGPALLAWARRAPAPWLRATAWGLAGLWWWIIPVRRGVAVANLRRMGTRAPAAAVRDEGALLREAFARTALGLLAFARWAAAAGHPSCGVRVDLAPPPPGSVIVAGHLGAWELALAGLARTRAAAVYVRAPRDAWVRGWLSRARAPARELDPREGLAPARRALDAGACVVFVQDQHVAGAPRVPFLGWDAATATGAVRLARERGLGVWGAEVRGDAFAPTVRFVRLALPDPLGDTRADAVACAAVVNAWLSGEVLRDPAAWMWMHRRWRDA